MMSGSDEMMVMISGPNGAVRTCRCGTVVRFLGVLSNFIKNINNFIENRTLGLPMLKSRFGCLRLPFDQGTIPLWRAGTSAGGDFVICERCFCWSCCW